MPIQIDEIERHHEIEIISDKFAYNRKRVKVKQPKAKPYFIVSRMSFQKIDKRQTPRFYGDIRFAYAFFKDFEWLTFLAVVGVYRTACTAKQNNDYYYHREAEQKHTQKIT